MTAEELFLTLLNRSLAAVWLVLAILLLRPFLKKVSRAFCCAIWGLVAFRLLCPFSLQSVLSLVPDAQPIPTDLAGVSVGAEAPVGAGIPAAEGSFASFLPSVSAVQEASPVQTLTRVAVVLWIVGMALIALYTLGSYLHLRALVREAVKHPDGYWLCDRIETPFVLGLFRPRILLPLAMDAGDLPYVLAHERAHLARRDHWRKPVAFALLTVFWFQPVLWVAYYLLRRDVEFACDERTIRKLGMDLESRKCYAKALLRGSSPRISVAKLPCPLAFGGLQVKRRVKSVMTYKRPAVTLLFAALLVCIAVAVCFLTDPISNALGMEIPVESAGMGGAATVETPDAPDDQAPADPVPDDPPAEETVVTVGQVISSDAQRSPGTEEFSEKEWMAQYDPSRGFSEENWKLLYVLRHIRQWYNREDGIPTMYFENTGTKDITLTFYEDYFVYTPFTDLEGYDPNTTPPNTWIGRDTITVEIPAGETVYVAIRSKYQEKADISQLVFYAGSYGDLSAMVEE